MTKPTQKDFDTATYILQAAENVAWYKNSKHALDKARRIKKVLDNG